ncbi:MAG: DUF58 domain-containing protein [Oligoflexia bacterium]|nr:DUF58 domain-containing protein [Oligoflexia bacterium]
MLPEVFSPRLLKHLGMLKVHARRAFLGSRQGGHVSVKRGHGIEFADYRRYELGDNPRHIDWGVYARSEKLIVKTFKEDQDLTVLIVVDPSSSMFNPPEGRKWQRVIEIVLGVAYVALLEQDSVRVAIPGSYVSPLLFGARAIHHLARDLAAIKPLPTAVFEREFKAALSRVRFPGVALFISDFLLPFEEVERLFLALRAKNLDITALQILSPEDREPFKSESDVVAIDSETSASVELNMSDEVRARYGRLLNEHVERVDEYCRSAGIAFTQADTNQDLEEVLLQTLPRTGLLR